MSGWPGLIKERTRIAMLFFSSSHTSISFVFFLYYSAHQKAVEFLHPAAQQQERDDPTAKAAYQQGQRVEVVPQDCRCRAKDCHGQKDKGADTRAAVIREIVEYDNGKIHTEHGIYPQAQDDEHMQHIGAGIQVGEEHADQADQYYGNNQLDLIHKKELMAERPAHDAPFLLDQVMGSVVQRGNIQGVLLIKRRLYLYNKDDKRWHIHENGYEQGEVMSRERAENADLFRHAGEKPVNDSRAVEAQRIGKTSDSQLWVAAEIGEEGEIPALRHSKGSYTLEYQSKQDDKITAGQGNNGRGHFINAKLHGTKKPHAHRQQRAEEEAESEGFIMLQRRGIDHHAVNIRHQHSHEIITYQEGHGYSVLIIHSRAQQKHENAGYGSGKCQHTECGGADVRLLTQKDTVRNVAGHRGGKKHSGQSSYYKGVNGGRDIEPFFQQRKARPIQQHL